MSTRAWLLCGILASLIYIGTDILAAMRYQGYSYTARAVSELSAVGAPTRPLVVPLFTVHGLLQLAFGVAVWIAASGHRGLRVSAVLLIVIGIVDLVAPLIPMHQRGAAPSLTDTMHILITTVTVLLILLAIAFGSTAGSWFRFYSFATIVLLIVGGGLAAVDGGRLAAGLPTPWLGITERVNIYGYMLWMAMLSLILVRARPT